MKYKKKYWVLSLSIAAIMYSCSSGKSQEPAEQMTAMPTDFIQLQSGNADVSTGYPGSIERQDNVDIKAQVTGYLEAVYVKEGQYVNKGQALFKINPSVYNEQVNNSEAALKSALASQASAKLEVDKLKPLVDGNVVSEMKLQYTAGQINSLAIQQSEAQKKTAELIVPLAKQNISVQENALSILCGEYPKSVERSEGLHTMISENPLTAEVPAQLLSRRPDLKAAEFNVISLNAKTGLAKAAMYPSISLSPQVGVNSFKVSTWFDLPGSITKTLAANLAMPLLQKRQLKTAYETEIIEQEKAVITFKQTMMTAVGEVSDAMAKSKGSNERLALLHERTLILEKGISDALKLYKSGMDTYLEVITAQNNKLQNDLEQNSVILEKLNAEVDLFRALGGGVE